jgi:hypothetical protein
MLGVRVGARRRENSPGPVLAPEREIKDFLSGDGPGWAVFRQEVTAGGNARSRARLASSSSCRLARPAGRGTRPGLGEKKRCTQAKVQMNAGAVPRRGERHDRDVAEPLVRFQATRLIRAIARDAYAERATRRSRLQQVVANELSW